MANFGCISYAMVVTVVLPALPSYPANQQISEGVMIR